ncbi:hypothetical protein ACF07Y_18830 [Streptomyces sp. NPDC016566]|uniref:hypothetical protein n=1 Tax=unclassified Streptomyces TaxID=2593676 RepID=UPI00119D5BB0|nr:hypothetical protein [Streptomyces sp. BK340]
MNTQSHPALEWIPATGIQLRKAGVQFDAVRLDGDHGRAVADRLARMTGGDPGPVVESGSGRRCVYFLVAAGSTAHHSWPEEVTRLTSGPYRVCYIPVPALEGMTWPLAWRYPPTAPGRLVHTLLLRTALQDSVDDVGVVGRVS